MHQLEHAGRDRWGRDVYLLFVEDLVQLTAFKAPSRRFVMFVGADTTSAVPEPLYSVASALLRAGAVYVLCWGPGSQRAEDVFDEAIVGEATADSYAILTTSHAEESIRDSLEFATTTAVPDDRFVDAVHSMVIAFVGNVNWYNEAQNCLEDLLIDAPDSRPHSA